MASKIWVNIFGVMKGNGTAAVRGQARASVAVPGLTKSVEKLQSHLIYQNTSIHLFLSHVWATRQTSVFKGFHICNKPRSVSRLLYVIIQHFDSICR